MRYAGLKRLGLQSIVDRPDAAGNIPAGAGAGRDLHREPHRRPALWKRCSRTINHVPTAQALACERAFLAALDGSCRTPIAGHATIDGDGLAFSGLILSPDGRQSHNVSSDGLAADAAEIGRTAGEKLRRNAGAHFFDGWN